MSEEQQARPAHQEPRQEQPDKSQKWFEGLTFAAVIVLASGLLLVALSWLGGKGVFLWAFESLNENLPLTLPILSASLSVLLNFRELLRRFGWLRLPTALSLGLVSFAIWYVVAAQSTGDEFIRIGTKRVLNREYAVILVVVAFIWAAFCAVARLLSESWDESDRGPRWLGAQVALLALSVVGLATPFFLFESKRDVEARIKKSLDERYFAVSLAFRDSTLTGHLGRPLPINQVIVFKQVRGRTASEAVNAARDKFLKSPDSLCLFGKAKEEQRVEIFDAWILAEQEPGYPDRIERPDILSRRDILSPGASWK